MGTITSFTIANNTITDIVNIDIDDFVGFDFYEEYKRPDTQLRGLKIKAGQSVTKDMNLRDVAKNCPFSMTLHYADGSKDTCKIRLKCSQEKDCFKNGCNHGNFSKIYHKFEKKIEENSYKITFSNTPQQQSNIRAEEANKKGEAKMRNKQFAQALLKFEEAEKQAYQKQTKQKIKCNKAETYNEFGKTLMAQAFKLESNINEDLSKEAKEKFDNARDMFEKAQNTNNKFEYRQNVKIMDLKIQGNALFNKANKVEQEAYKMFEKIRNSDVSGNYDAAQDRYAEALELYKQAAQKFDEGRKVDEDLFKESFVFAQEQVESVEQIIEDMERIELTENMTQVKFDEQKTQNEAHAASEKDKNVQMQL